MGIFGFMFKEAATGPKAAFSDQLGAAGYAQATAPVANGAEVSDANPLPGSEFSTGADYAPGYGPSDEARLPSTIDPGGNKKSRAQILTDEGGYRCNYANASLAVSIGTCTFETGSYLVTGTGFTDVDLHIGNYIYLDADGLSAQVQVDYMTDTTILLAEPYSGAGGTGAASRQIVKSVVGAGASITVSNGQCTIVSGTTNGSVTELERSIDYLPLVREGRFSISARNANQTVEYGAYDENNGSSPRWWTLFKYDGIVNTVVKCECAWNPTTTPTGGEIVTQTITLPAGLTSATQNTHWVEILKDRVVFIINDVIVHTERRVVPHPHALQVATLRVINGTSPGASTTIVSDYDSCANFNVVSVENPSRVTSVLAPPPPLARTEYSLAGVITINTVLIQIDCQGYKSLEWQCSSMGTTGVVTPEWSANGTTWVAATSFTPGGSSATTFNAAGNWVANVQARHFRLRLSTATTGGTTTIHLDACTVRQQTWLATQPVSGTVTANIGTLTSPSASARNSTADTNLVSVKASAGSFYGIKVFNGGAATAYIKLYNKASAPVLASDIPIMVIPVAAGASANETWPFPGYRFATGIAMAITGGAGDTDTTAVAAGQVKTAISYI